MMQYELPTQNKNLTMNATMKMLNVLPSRFDQNAPKIKCSRIKSNMDNSSISINIVEAYSQKFS